MLSIQILDGPPAGSIGQWTCVSTGSIGVNVNFEINGNVSNVIINGTDAQILSIFGGMVVITMKQSDVIFAVLYLQDSHVIPSLIQLEYSSGVQDSCLQTSLTSTLKILMYTLHLMRTMRLQESDASYQAPFV